MSKIKDLPTFERPREKAYRFGIEQLSDYELIAILIGTGCQNKSATDIAYQMISDSTSLSSLIQRPYIDLLKYKGIGKNKAIKIIASFEIAKRFQSRRNVLSEESIDSNSLFLKYYPQLVNQHQEHLFIVILDKKKRVLHEVNLYKGNDKNVSYSCNQIIREVLIHEGTSFYVIHNHPSGTLMPSEQDIFFTSYLIQEAKRMKITLIDHLIISSEGYYSFLEQKMVEVSTDDINQQIAE